MKKQIVVLAVLVVVMMSVETAQAAFMVETHSTGRGYSNFSGTGPSYTAQDLAAAAPGLLATQCAFGGNAVAPNMDTYVFSYTPGVHADNWTVPLDNRYFGNGLYSTNLTGGQTGYYNVYITWLPTTTNVDTDGCNLYITHDNGVTSWLSPANAYANGVNFVNQNVGGTNWIAESWGPFVPGTIISGGNGKWLKIAHEVVLTAGNSYTVTIAANDNAYVSMRASGVMWEFVAIPEPATLVLLGLGGLCLRKRS